jgi:hypothetical protein
MRTRRSRTSRGSHAQAGCFQSIFHDGRRNAPAIGIMGFAIADLRFAIGRKSQISDLGFQISSFNRKSAIANRKSRFYRTVDAFDTTGDLQFEQGNRQWWI